MRVENAALNQIDPSFDDLILLIKDCDEDDESTLGLQKQVGASNVKIKKSG